MPQSPEQKREVIEVVAEPMLDDADPGGEPKPPWRPNKALGRILAGFIIDGVDFTTFSPVAGLLLGSLTGFWLAGHLEFTLRQRFVVALCCGVYCMVPPTSFFPLATLLAVWANVRTSTRG